MVMNRWKFSEEPDSWHLNSLAVWNGRVVFSAFCDQHKSRGYKERSRGEGFVQDLLSGRRLITGLSQPHSLCAFEERLLVANSEACELVEFSASWTRLRSLRLGEYVRGIEICGSTIYAGLGRSRNLEKSSLEHAKIVATSYIDFRFLGELSLPANEIYDIEKLEHPDKLGLNPEVQ